MMFIAIATMELASLSVAGTISVFPSFARFPNGLIYCSATRS